MAATIIKAPFRPLGAFLIVVLFVFASPAAAFQASMVHRRYRSSSSSQLLQLHAKKPKKAAAGAKSGGGGFGSSRSKPSSNAASSTISADKDALEKQWDTFASITDLEIAPKGDPDDEDYRHFEVCDVFVRVRSGESDDKGKGTGWFRTGKVVSADDGDGASINIAAAVALQKGLIFWTAVHMFPQIVAAGGTSGASKLEVGYTDASIYMASNTDGALDEEEAEAVQLSERVSVKNISIKSIGFRPDYNPPGFSYKRREKAAMKKKKSNNLQTIADC
eukprot:CAMPEP_0198284694 /NCGR_PEP_ID=MMETSP1449-20131203/4156_1 /TAXON_ID=420275 /ORGANISM="Attheya septentrionalis, Strain CCMP2084" /LENGTH=276 /DNA_ID=CAMNT_0043981897 /DNA_START=118 /DNA_END=948 /DNA_ORIENTATION=+